jgi:hypothetical protein
MMSRSNVAASGPAMSTRHQKVQFRRDWLGIGSRILRLVAVGLLAWLGWLHLNLWLSGYRHIPGIGPSFLVAALGAMALALAMAVRPSRLFGLMGFVLVIGILGGVILSVNVGLFGFTESLRAPFVVESIVLEIAASVTLAMWVTLDAKNSRRNESSDWIGSRISRTTRARYSARMSPPRLRMSSRNQRGCEAHR